ncbi:D-alanyl-D-alanine carboxypeptidase/D-alanyl-D-alanine endopeptidase [Leifsonia kafniensis]|uniref:D-alanyl-D-alanine carboxypeptidase/D-alanyl-D-alanine endopeptidase n=1 Tax=Leifsonia kafniensis TaxID=475957 RepID=UPI0031ED2EAE
MQEPDPELTGRPDSETPAEATPSDANIGDANIGDANIGDANLGNSSATEAPAQSAPATDPAAASATTDAASASATQPPRPGFLAFLGRHRVASSIVAGVAVFALLGTGAVMAGAATGTPAASPVAASTPTSAPTPTETATIPPRSVPAADAVASRLRTCSVASLATDSRLGSFQGQVLNANTGEILFDRGGSTPSRTASVLKVLTSAAALSVLGPDYRATTTVVAGSEPGSIVLVGGGDLTLSRTSTGDESVYPGAAHLDSLADQAIAAWEANPANAGTPITSLVLDASFFGDPGWDPSWNRKELTDGYMPEITALQVDGDRDSPYSNTSARSEDPIGRAGEAFAELLPGSVSISRGTAPAGAAVLGTVQSAPVSTLIQQTLIVSDNAIAEMLGRLVAVESGAGNTFAAMGTSTVAGLAPYGIDTTGIVIADGSGLSDNNAVPPSYLTQLFLKINAREGNLGVIFDGLPIAGETGSLSYSDRFSGANSVADGAVFAKTGWIDTGYTLAGVIHAADGTPLTFAVYALGDVGDSAKDAIDTITAGFFNCGDNLSNN